MSNADLYAEKSRIERELYRIRAENSRLQGEINRAVGQIDSMRSQLQSFENSVNGALAASEKKMNNSISMSDQALGLQQQIEELYHRNSTSGVILLGLLLLCVLGIGALPKKKKVPEVNADV